jgi:hypothetical protein
MKSQHMAEFNSKCQTDGFVEISYCHYLWPKQSQRFGTVITTPMTFMVKDLGSPLKPTYRKKFQDILLPWDFECVCAMELQQ